MTCSYCLSEIKKENQNFNDICIDGLSKEHPLEHLDSLFQICPNCKIVSDNLEKYLNNPKYAQIIKDEIKECRKIQKLVNDNTLNELEKKLLLIKTEKDARINVNDKYWDIAMLLFIYCHTQGMNDKANECINIKLEKTQFAVENLKKYYQSEGVSNDILNNSFSSILSLIEMYRQIGDFKNAKKYIDILKKYKSFQFEKYQKKILKLQEELCKNKNTERILKPEK